MRKKNDRYFFGFLLIAVGLLIILGREGLLDFDLGDLISNIWPGALILFGLWLIYKQAKGEKNIDLKIDGVSSSKAFGDIKLKPETIAPEGAEYDVNFGQIQLDFTETNFPSIENKIKVSIDMGEIKIVLPSNLPVNISTTCGIGEVKILDKKSGGITSELNHVDDNYSTAVKKLKLHIKCGTGAIEVKRSNVINQ